MTDFPASNFRITDAEAVIVRRALMFYRNAIASFEHGDSSDGFEGAVADVLISRLDTESASILRRQRENSEVTA